jgi:hypothetical protein
MFELEEIIHQLAQRDEVVIRGERFRLKNVVTASENNILKTRIILESISSTEHVDIDVGISARIYKR